MGRTKVKFWNMLTRVRRSNCEPQRLLILLPSCLQCSECERKITNDLDNCRRCGRCPVNDVLEMAEKYGCRVAMATGGRLAMKLAKDDQIDAVVAVACEKELQEGLKGVFPKPALGVINLRPHGPCTDTQVDLEELEATLRWFLE